MHLVNTIDHKHTQRQGGTAILSQTRLTQEDQPEAKSSHLHPTECTHCTAYTGLKGQRLTADCGEFIVEQPYRYTCRMTRTQTAPARCTAWFANTNF